MSRGAGLGKSDVESGSPEGVNLERRAPIGFTLKCHQVVQSSLHCQNPNSTNPLRTALSATAM